MIAGAGTALGCPTEARLSLNCFRLEVAGATGGMPFLSRDFPVGCVRTSCPVGVGGWPSRNPVGISQSGPVGIRTQSGFSSRDFAQSGFLQSGPSRDSQSGQSAQSGPSRDFQLPSRDFPVGPQSGFCPVGISQSGPSRILSANTPGFTAPWGLPQSGSVAQSGRACSQSGSSRDGPVGDWPQSGSSRDSPVGPSRELAPVGNAQSGFCPVGNCSVGLQSGFPSRVFRASRASVGFATTPVGPQSGSPVGFFAQSGLSRDSQSGLFCQSGLSRVLSAPSRAPVGQPRAVPSSQSAAPGLAVANPSRGYIWFPSLPVAPPYCWAV